MDDDFFSVVKRQRACRRYLDKPVSDSLVEEVITAGTFAPSAENSQPWEFVVVRDKYLRDQIHDLAQRAWSGGGRDFSLRHLDEKILADVDDGISGGGYATAPVMIIVAGDTERCHPKAISASILPAIQNMLLAATALGLGSALTTITLGFATELQAIVALPDSVVPQAIIPLGFPARPLGPPRRESFSQHTHCDQFGNAWGQAQ
jgi:nitroreductase